MKNNIKKILVYIQKPLLYLSYYFFKAFGIKSNKKISWVVGTHEIASNIHFLGNILDNTTTVSLTKNRYYDLEYDYSIDINNIYLRFIYEVFYAPILLGYLANKNTHFWYIWSTGFLLDRDCEFKFLKSKNKKIVCMFVGDDIRSPKLSLELAKSMNIDHFIEYVGSQTPYYMSEKYDKEKKQLAQSADRYADMIISAKYDQASYLKSEQISFPYMYDKNKFSKNENKYNNLKKIKILHAPSNPFVKGTPLVRAAIKKLEIEGYEFEYTELQKMPNSVVLEHLKTSHIVLNQFHGFAPGLFGIEAMANHCAVLMSADPSIETGLPQDSQDAWMITKYWQVYDNIKYLLDNPEKIKYYADRGYEFAYKHYTYEAAGEYINTVLKENGVVD